MKMNANNCPLRKFIDASGEAYYEKTQVAKFLGIARLLNRFPNLFRRQATRREIPTLKRLGMRKGKKGLTLLKANEVKDLLELRTEKYELPGPVPTKREVAVTSLKNLQSASRTTSKKVANTTKKLSSQWGRTSKRPLYSFTKLVSQAMLNSQNRGLAIHEIENWITETYPFYRLTQLKYSVRHRVPETLSSSPYFIEDTASKHWFIAKDYEAWFREIAFAPHIVNENTGIRFPINLEKEEASLSPVASLSSEVMSVDEAFETTLVSEVGTVLTTSAKIEKPPYGFTKFVAQALLSSSNRGLTRYEIAHWISETYPYFRLNEFKQSVVNRVTNELSSSQSYFISGNSSRQWHITEEYIEVFKKIAFIPQTVNEKTGSVQRMNIEKEKALLTSVQIEKPPYGFVKLVGQALLSSPNRGLTRYEIANWISETYPYFRSYQFKDSVVANVTSTLSRASYFTRVKASNLWYIVKEYEDSFKEVAFIPQIVNEVTGYLQNPYIEKKKKEKSSLTSIKLGKPLFGFTKLVGQALLSSQNRGLTRHEIANWISETYPYYRSNNFKYSVVANVTATVSRASYFIRYEGSSRWYIDKEYEDSFRKIAFIPQIVNDRTGNLMGINIEKEEASLTTETSMSEIMFVDGVSGTTSESVVETPMEDSWSEEIGVPSLFNEAIKTIADLIPMPSFSVLHSKTSQFRKMENCIIEFRPECRPIKEKVPYFKMEPESPRIVATSVEAPESREIKPHVSNFIDRIEDGEHEKNEPVDLTNGEVEFGTSTIAIPTIDLTDDDDIDLRVQCPICDVYFSTKYGLGEHVLGHKKLPSSGVVATEMRETVKNIASSVFGNKRDSAIFVFSGNVYFTPNNSATP